MAKNPLEGARARARALGMGKSLAALGRGVSSSCSITLRNPEDTGAYSGLKYSPSNPLSNRCLPCAT